MLLCVYQRKGGFFYFYEHGNTFDCCLVTTRIAPQTGNAKNPKQNEAKTVNLLPTMRLTQSVFLKRKFPSVDKPLKKGL